MSLTTPPSPASSNTDDTPKRRVRVASLNISSYALQLIISTTKRIKTSMSLGLSRITSTSSDLNDDDERRMCL